MNNMDNSSTTGAELLFTSCKAQRFEPQDHALLFSESQMKEILNERVHESSGESGGIFPLVIFNIDL